METQPAALTDDLIEEFLLRLPPEDPMSLVRAALVCRRWRRILTDRGFRRWFCEHHRRRPPMLGYFRLGPTAATMRPLLMPTSSFRPRYATGVNINYMKAIDSRHGCVLISDAKLEHEPSASRLSVWDPITGELLTLPTLPQGKPLPPSANFFSWKAVVLCATTSPSSTAAGCCDCHCHGGPFRVVLIGTSRDEVYTFVYTSQDGVWSHTTSVARHTLGPISSTSLFHPLERATTVAGDAVYFKLFMNNVRILKYSLGAQEISSVDLPDRCRRNIDDPCQGCRILLLTATEYVGLLGVACMNKTRIDLWWSREAGPGGCFRWEPPRVIGLQDVPHANPCFRWEPLAPRLIEPHSLFYVVDIVHSLGAVIIRARDGVFSVDIESKKATKLCDNNYATRFVPYMSFCTPGEGPCAGVSK